MVFYNGTDAVDDRVELRLSEAYEHLAGEPDLELKVLMLNVNEGHNKDLMEQCQTLKEYAIYVARVRKYASELNLNDAVERAIDGMHQRRNFSGISSEESLGGKDGKYIRV